MDPVIQNAQPANIPAITRIYANAVLHGRASFELIPPSENEMRRRYDELTDNDYPYIVAIADGILAGYAYAGPYRSRPGYKWSVENTVYIDPSFHNMGLGTLLLERLIEICTGKNYRQMIAVIGDSANIGSIRIHEKAGFTHCGTLKSVGRKHGVWLDSVFMQLQLGRGDADNPE